MELGSPMYIFVVCDCKNQFGKMWVSIQMIVTLDPMGPSNEAFRYGDHRCKNIFSGNRIFQKKHFGQDLS